jgi:hypothetical protein
MRRLRLLLPLSLLIVGLIAVPATSQARYLVGFSDQQSSIFTDPLFTALHVKYARLIVSYDVAKARTGELAIVDQWLNAARAAGVRPLVSFNYRRGCFNPVTARIPRTARCRAPSLSAYRSAFRAFRKRFPFVKEYSPWNEANHFSQPVSRNPRRAAQYYNIVRSLCRGCRIVALDVLDQHTVRRSKNCPKGCLSAVAYYRKFRHYAKRPSIFGLHNYSDTNRRRSTGTRAFLRAIGRKQLWLTETGGVVKLGRGFPYSQSRAAKALRFMFKLARSNKRIKRLYIYQWTGAPRGARFDAGIINPDGTPRPGYSVVKKYVR